MSIPCSCPTAEHLDHENDESTRWSSVGAGLASDITNEICGLGGRRDEPLITALGLQLADELKLQVV